MADKMTLLYVEAVGQVVGALTRTAAPEADRPAADLAGEAFALRGEPGEAEFAIPADEIAVATVDRDDAVLLEPSRYHVVDGVSVLPGGQVNAVTPGAEDVTVDVSIEPENLPEPATSPVTAWVLFQNGATAAPVVVTAEIPVGETKSAAFRPPVDPGDYDVLAMAEGYRLERDTVTIP